MNNKHLYTQAKQARTDAQIIESVITDLIEALENEEEKNYDLIDKIEKLENEIIELKSQL